MKERCKDYTERITAILKKNLEAVDQDGGRQLQDWDEYTEINDREFRTEFEKAISDETIPEEDESFTPGTFGDTYLNKRLRE